MPVKKEPGTGTAAAENKKKFVPNLKVQRRKEEMKLEVREERKINIPTASKGHARDKQGGKAISLSSSSDGAATNRRPKPELIQTMAGSVFSEGVSGEGIRRKVGGGYGGGSGGGRDSEPLRRPVLSKESKGSADKEAEEKRLKALLRDDFISDLSSEGLYVPVQEAAQEGVLGGAQGEVRQAAGEGVLGRALGGLLGRGKGGVQRLRRPVLPAGAHQGLQEGDREAAEGGVRAAGHQDEDQDRDQAGRGEVVILPYQS